MISPAGIQLSRERGFRLHQASFALNGLECRRVDRASAFGNPFKFLQDEGCIKFTMDEECRDVAIAGELVARFRRWIREPAQAALLLRIRSELRGCNLACWCRLDRPCHADVLLELANA